MKRLILISAFLLSSTMAVNSTASISGPEEIVQQASCLSANSSFFFWLRGFGDGSFDGQTCNANASYNPGTQSEEAIIQYDIGYRDGFQQTCN